MQSVLQRFRLLLEFEGGAFRGWQRQGEANIRTVQGVLLSAAAEIFGTNDIDLQGNGRTDAGVHALEYVAHLEVATTMLADEITPAFNRLLPKDIAILEVQPADSRFHARHHCVGRSYLYQIAEGQMAFMRRYAWSLEDGLDFSLMRQAADIFLGMHDFLAFAEKQEQKKSPKVLVEALQVARVGQMILVRVVASHFLWHLVRR
ncbi:MAG: tRNA pseudouridine(38-40) synthase TruA, partial [Desulfobulbaceae bacterium]|nr:tRNA pseudouridine(38-40) synthase TruA [Desulfobulbaceae bacterium]